MVDNIKNLGQVHTPKHIVNDMLDLLDYSGEKILEKHIIDNCCGDGAFLMAIIERYLVAYQSKWKSLYGVCGDLEKYIHGIEIDTSEYIQCMSNLDGCVMLKGLINVQWDIINGDALKTKEFDGKMDYVVGNPPYVRIHNLQNDISEIRNFLFCKLGMTDLYLVFYEIGFAMLNDIGKLCYITPNSFYSSIAGDEFRRFIFQSKHLYSLIDLGHYQPFKFTTYTTICAFDNGNKYNELNYCKYESDGKICYKDKLRLTDVFNYGKMIVAEQKAIAMLKCIHNYSPKNKNMLFVKNGFATLADSIFINREFAFSNNVIDVIKASTGEWKKCIFPYDNEQKILLFDKLDKETQRYMLDNRNELKKRSLDKNSPWYAFGRSQAIKDINKRRICINTTIKDLESIKINEVPIGKGIYSGLYIITNLPIKKIENYIRCDEFIMYIRALGKCKSGGYYTFSSLDLEKYLIYKMENSNE